MLALNKQSAGLHTDDLDDILEDSHPLDDVESDPLDSMTSVA